MKCVECVDYAECSKKHNLTIKRKHCPMAKIEYVQTNADRIRASTDSELEADILAISLGYIPWCDGHCESQGEDGCDNCIREWLNQPAEDEQ